VFTTEAQRAQRRVSVCPARWRDKQKYLPHENHIKTPKLVTDFQRDIFVYRYLPIDEKNKSPSVASVPLW
jgi:hypothetical protein